MAQLRHGARQALDILEGDLQMLEEHAHNPGAVRNLVASIRRHIKNEIEPQMQRAAPPVEKRIDELEERLARLETERKVTQFRKAE